MNGNGFKFGSKTTEQSTNVKRTANYCVAFDHKSKGFDNNNSQGCTGYISNCASLLPQKISILSEMLLLKTAELTNSMTLLTSIL